MEVFTYDVKICQKDQRNRQQKRAEKRLRVNKALYGVNVSGQFTLLFIW